MKDNPIGLDIGSSSIKAVWLAEEKEGFVLKSASETRAPIRGMLSESPIDREEMVQAIKNIINEGKITSASVNIALPENQVYTKVLEMPLLSDKELSSAIYWEAEQYIPVPLENMTLDWRVLKKPNPAGTNKKMEVLLVGAQTALIEKYQKIIESAGLSINSLETEILAVIRSAIREENFPDSVIIHIGTINTLLTIVRDGILCFAYSIPTGGTAMNRAIAADFGFSMDQAEEYKKTYGISEKTLGGKIGKATIPIIMFIINEVKKALAFYNEKYKNEGPIRQILLSGGNSKLPGLDVFFAQNCGLETVILNPWKVLKNQNVPKEIIDNAPDYTIAVGLAMREYERD